MSSVIVTSAAAESNSSPLAASISAFTITVVPDSNKGSDVTEVIPAGTVRVSGEPVKLPVTVQVLAVSPVVIVKSYPEVPAAKVQVNAKG